MPPTSVVWADKTQRNQNNWRSHRKKDEGNERVTDVHTWQLTEWYTEGSVDLKSIHTEKWADRQTRGLHSRMNGSQNEKRTEKEARACNWNVILRSKRSSLVSRDFMCVFRASTGGAHCQETDGYVLSGSLMASCWCHAKENREQVWHRMSYFLSRVASGASCYLCDSQTLSVSYFACLVLCSVWVVLLIRVMYSLVCFTRHLSRHDRITGHLLIFFSSLLFQSLWSSSSSCISHSILSHQDDDLVTQTTRWCFESTRVRRACYSLTNDCWTLMTSSPRT